LSLQKYTEIVKEFLFALSYATFSSFPKLLTQNPIAHAHSYAFHTSYYQLRSKTPLQIAIPVRIPPLKKDEDIAVARSTW